MPHAYALTEPTHAGVRPSIQIFDAHGDAVHKVYQTEATDAEAFARLIAAFADPGAPPACFEAAPRPDTPDRAHGPSLAQGAVQQVLERAAEGHVPLRIVVGNRGCVQGYAGPVEAIKLTGPWVNVLDPRFNLHLRWDRIAQTRLVTEHGGPTVSDGW